MLIGLSINNVILIDALDLTLMPGFTALTGETGAGKSILLDALSLALGAKGDPDFIRPNSDLAVVVATFSLTNFPADHAVFELIKEHDLDIHGDLTNPESAQLMLKRTLHRTQKGKTFINDQAVSLALLKQFGDILLNVHGQHDHLLNENAHKILLDDFAQSNNVGTFDTALSATKESYGQWLTAKNALVSFEKECIEQKAQRAFYEQVWKDLKNIKLELGTEDRLLEQRQSLQQLGKIITTVEQTLKGLESPTPWVSALYGFQKNLERCHDGSFKALQNAISAFERAGIELKEAQEELRNLYEADRTAAHELEQIDEHLHMLRGLARKYHTTCDGLCELATKAEKASLNDDDILLQRRTLETAVQNAHKNYVKCEGLLYTLRCDAAKTLAAAVMRELPDLKLDRAVFEVRVQQNFESGNNAPALKPAIDGGHAVAFWVSMNQGQNAAPLVKTASGGEMARLMLVLKMIIAKSTAMPTLIFDEIDTGVGGAVATAIGQKLRALGQFVQVLSITHSPQVAAAANHHWRIYKTITGDLTTTQVVDLPHNERVDEIARMLAGATLTNEAKLAAQALMNE